MASKEPKRRSYREQRGLPKKAHYRAQAVADRPLFDLSPKSLAIACAVLTIVFVGLCFGVWKAMTTPKLDTAAYQENLVSVGRGDLPAPPFIGWEQKILENPPGALEPNSSISEVNVEACTPGGERQNELAGLIMHNATKWSGTEMYNTAYNAQIRVDVSNSFQENDGREGGLDLGIIDRWLQDCSYIEFNQDTIDAGSKTVRITYEPLPADMKAWDLSDGRAWVQTVATSSAERFEGATSTIWSFGYGNGSTMQAQLTFEGYADDTAVSTMDMLWTSQAVKLKEAA